MTVQLELEMAIDAIAEELYKKGFSADEIEEMLTGEAHRVSEEIKMGEFYD